MSLHDTIDLAQSKKATSQDSEYENSAENSSETDGNRLKELPIKTRTMVVRSGGCQFTIIEKSDGKFEARTSCKGRKCDWVDLMDNSKAHVIIEPTTAYSSSSTGSRNSTRSKRMKRSSSRRRRTAALSSVTCESTAPKSSAVSSAPPDLGRFGFMRKLKTASKEE